jgi:hypothetical protein
MKFETFARWVAIAVFIVMFGLLFFMMYGKSGILIAPLLVAIIDITFGIGRESPLFARVKKALEEDDLTSVFRQRNCRGCGKLRIIPEEHELDKRMCDTPGCYYMLFHDGSQTTDAPGE